MIAFQPLQLYLYQSSAARWQQSKHGKGGREPPHNRYAQVQITPFIAMFSRFTESTHPEAPAVSDRRVLKLHFHWQVNVTGVGTYWCGEWEQAGYRSTMRCCWQSTTPTSSNLRYCYPLPKHVYLSRATRVSKDVQRCIEKGPMVAVLWWNATMLAC